MTIEGWLLLILSVLVAFVLSFWLGVHHQKTKEDNKPKLTYWQKVAKKGEESFEMDGGIEAYISEPAKERDSKGRYKKKDEGEE